MPKKKPGRPTSPHPRDSRVTIRLTEQEIDELQRLNETGLTLAELVRQCISHYVQTQTMQRFPVDPFTGQRRDHPHAQQQRALRAARRANAAPQPELEQHIAEASLGPEEELSASMPQGKVFQHVKHLLP
jgi:hypothetical protein